VFFTLAKTIVHTAAGFFVKDFYMLRVLHFNDVYNMERGASTFAHFIKHKQQNHICLFSGDAFSPSIVSPKSKGMHMVDLFNHIGVHAATPGNHEFDDGINNARKAFLASKFPWVSSNLRLKKNKRSIPGTVSNYFIRNNDIRIGFVGIAEKDWLNTIKDGVHMEVVDASDIIRETRDKCDVLIALTHMSLPNDIKFAGQYPEVDLIFGGHDHEVIVHKNIIKSGTDFENFSEVCYDVKDKRVTDYTVCDTSTWTSKDVEVEAMVSRHMATVSQESDNDVIFVSPKDMDATTRVVRSVRGTHTVVQYACERVWRALGKPLDCFVMLNGGTFRANRVYKKDHPFTEVDMRGLMPWDVPLYVTQISGRSIKEIVRVSDEGVLQGMFHGRFMHYNANLDVSSLDDDTLYFVVTTDFLATGGDGYGDLFGENVSPIGFSIQDALRGKMYGAFKPDALIAAGTTSGDVTSPDDLFS